MLTDSIQCMPLTSNQHAGREPSRGCGSACLSSAFIAHSQHLCFPSPELRFYMFGFNIFTLREECFHQETKQWFKHFAISGTLPRSLSTLLRAVTWPRHRQGGRRTAGPRRAPGTSLDTAMTSGTQGQCLPISLGQKPLQ